MCPLFGVSANRGFTVLFKILTIFARYSYLEKTLPTKCQYLPKFVEVCTTKRMESNCAYFCMEVQKDVYNVHIFSCPIHMYWIRTYEYINEAIKQKNYGVVSWHSA